MRTDRMIQVTQKLSEIISELDDLRAMIKKAQFEETYDE
tara:strand:- start:239 stop:355 length:117 start_codon:yes stop_codon:yes gene_type:complete